MSGELAGVDLKIGRAKSDLADLKQAVEGALHPDRYSFTMEYHAQSQKHIYRVHNVPVVDPKWSLQIGEIAYQLRSALDHLAWQLVLLDGKTPGEDTQFPVRDTRRNKHGELLPVKVLLPKVKSGQILQLLDECQPYKGDGSQEVSQFEAHRSPLWVLRGLNNIDKHRLLLVAACVLDIGSLWFGLPAGVPKPTLSLSAAPLKENSPVARFDFHGAEPPTDFNPHPALQIVVREPDIPRITHVNIIGALEMFCWWVEWHVVTLRFRPLFP